MPEEDKARARKRLLDRRREILERVEAIEEQWQVLGERDVELEEEAQKADVSSLFNELDARGRKQIEEIDLALLKLATEDYGICEGCGRRISHRRLQAVPEARLCRKCALRFDREKKNLPEAADLIACSEGAEEYRNLGDDELGELIMEQLRDDGRVETTELQLTCRNGVIYLDGAVPSETEHQILLQILTDIVCFGAVIDHLRTDELLWERAEQAPKPDSEPTAEEVLLYGTEDLRVNETIESDEDETLHGLFLS